jgi:hypothetical protein
VPAEPGDSNKKLPERGDALRIDLPFEEAVRAALKTSPQPAIPKTKRKRKAT